MIYLGIDVAKNKHDACFLDSKGNQCCQTFSFNNTKAGFDKLKNTISTILNAQAETEIKVELEATGHYSKNLVAFLHSLGLSRLCLILYK